MKPKTATIISFYELSDEWQDEATSNLDEWAEDAMYLEPDEDHNPTEYALYDLEDCMMATGERDGFKYNAVIGISNNTAMLLNVSEDGESAEYIIA